MRAVVLILSVNERNVQSNFEGIIKREHMRRINIDKIQTENICEPGDIIIARIKSLSETKKILLTIEDDDLGVIMSKDSQNNLLIPIN